MSSEFPATTGPAAAAPGFGEAMAMTSSLLDLWSREELSDEVLADRIGALVATRDGARGFFVVAMAGESPLMDRLSPALVQQLRRAGEGVIDLTVRNLAMSSAMAVEHRRNGDRAHLAGSERVQQRCLELLRQLDNRGVKQRLEAMLRAAADGEGEDVAFLERWGYDSHQRAAIAASLEAVAEGGSPPAGSA